MTPEERAAPVAEAMLALAAELEARRAIDRWLRAGPGRSLRVEGGEIVICVRAATHAGIVSALVSGGETGSEK